MQPLGNHIQINAPEELTVSNFIVEKEAVMKAKVIKLSPDIAVPFKENDTVYFYRSRQIPMAETLFLNLEMIVGYLAAAN